MRANRRVSAALVGAYGLWMVAAAGARLVAQNTVPADVTTALAKAGGSSIDDVPSLLAGRTVVRTSVAPEQLSASVVAAVRIQTPLERTVAYFRQLLAYVDGQTTLLYSPVMQPSEPSDFRDQTLDASDLTELRNCAPGRCGVRVGHVPLEAARAAVIWDATDAPQRANTWLRAALSDSINAYQRAGDAALRGYDERGEPVDMAALWDALERESPIPAALAPGLQQYLGRFPGARPAEATNEFYTDRQHFTGLSPVVGITHLITWRDPSVPQRVVVAQKQIAATRYVFGSLAVTMFVQDTASPPATYVVYTNQTRGDLLRGTQAAQQTGIRGRISGLGASVQRRLGEQMVRQSAESLLSSMKTALER